MGNNEGGVPTGMGRREFFTNVVLVVAATMGVGALASRFLQFLYPVVPAEREIEVPIIERSAIPRGGGIVVHSPVGHIAVEDVSGEIRAFSAVCTHLGCIVTWQPTDNHVWYCPCHKGKYDRAGRVVSGPPPRPLDAFPATVRDGQVFVKLRVRPPAPTPGVSG
jgi:cytochrome b6-f complex iron-sulfur subunit